MKLAFVFPGQGSQSVGMLDSVSAEPAVADLMSRADAVLSTQMCALIHNGPAEELNLTLNTQPAVLLSSFALYALYRARAGIEPAMMAGHSLGEYSALVAAGALSFEDAIATVRYRAQLMQSAVPVGVGAMAAIIGLSDEQIADICQQSGAEAVNFNSPGQTVIAGHTEAVNRCCELARELKARRALILPVSAPFHSSLMRPIVEPLAQKLRSLEIRKPDVPVIANLDVLLHEGAENSVLKLANQAAGAVQWVKTIELMKAQGIDTVVECGPGRVLTGLIKRIAPEMKLYNINSLESLEALLSDNTFQSY